MIAGVTAPPRWQCSSASGDLARERSGHARRIAVSAAAGAERGRRSGPELDVPRPRVVAVRVAPGDGHRHRHRAPTGDRPAAANADPRRPPWLSETPPAWCAGPRPAVRGEPRDRRARDPRVRREHHARARSLAADTRVRRSGRPPPSPSTLAPQARVSSSGRVGRPRAARRPARRRSRTARTGRRTGRSRSSGTRPATVGSGVSVSGGIRPVGAGDGDIDPADRASRRGRRRDTGPPPGEGDRPDGRDRTNSSGPPTTVVADRGLASTHSSSPSARCPPDPDVLGEGPGLRRRRRAPTTDRPRVSSDRSPPSDAGRCQSSTKIG